MAFLYGSPFFDLLLTFSSSDQEKVHPDSETGKPTTNSFSVPDDDDEVVEVSPDSLSAEMPSEHHVVIPDSDSESESDSSNEVELSSPVTSPETKHSDASEARNVQTAVKGSKHETDDANPCEGSLQSPILLDRDEPPLKSGGHRARPAGMPPKRVLGQPFGHTPPGAYPSFQEDDHVEIPDNDQDSADDSDQSSDDDWNSNREDLSDEEGSDSNMSAKVDDGYSDTDSSSVASNTSSLSPEPYSVAHNDSVEHSEAGDSDDENEESSRSTNDPFDEERIIGRSSSSQISSSVAAQAPASDAQVPTIFPQDNSRLGQMSNPIRYQDNWSVDYSVPRAPSPSDKAMAKTSNAPLSSYPYGSFTPTFEEWSALQQSGQPPQLSFPPFPQAALVNNLSSYADAAHETFAFSSHQSSEGYLNHYSEKAASVSSQFVHPPSSPSFENVRGQVTGSDFIRPKSHLTDRSDKPNLEHTVSTTRVSISDIVEKSTGECHASAQTNPLKRKAADFEADMAVSNTSSLDNHTAVLEDSSFPDAQPRPVIQGPALSESQLTEIPAQTEPKPAHPTDIDAKQADQRRKRVKTARERGGNFMRYAATAVMGAVVGSIATVATLASLPPDFFD